MVKQQFKRLVFQPETYRGIQHGVNQMVSAVRPTLGPRPRNVAIGSYQQNKQPELLDNGAVIARRVIQLPNRDSDVGAMLVREMLWQLHDTVGDGTATAAVIFEAIFNAGIQYLAAGGSAPRLRHYLDLALRDVVVELAAMAQPVEGKTAFTNVAQSICHDPELAAMLGEIFDIIGEHGQLDVRTGQRRGLEREYIEGSYWAEGILIRSMLDNQPQRTLNLENAALLLTDFDINEPEDLVPALQAALAAKAKALVIVARSVSEKVIGFLATNSKPEKFQVTVVKTPGSTAPDQAGALQDMAALTGGTPISRRTGQSLETVQASDLGWARSVWTNRFNFGIRGGRGDARQLRAHLRSLQANYEQLTEPDDRKKMRLRIGKLMGGSAQLKVGAATESEVKTRKALAERTAEAVRGAVRDGVLPGGGVALLACAEKLRQCQPENEDQRAALGILATALEAPFRVIVTNAGYDASTTLARMQRAGGYSGLNVETGEIVDVIEAGVVDAAAVQLALVRRAVGAAALALTIDVMVHRKKQREATSLTPGKSNAASK